MHQIARGGFLKVHIDFNWYPRLKLERRLNVLIYLNENWKEEYGGYFELWNKDMTKSEVKILPVFNRMAMFTTGEESYHGHPDVLTCPEGMTRKSLALYYYTSPATHKEAQAEAHSTVFKERPGEEFHQSKKGL
jgi:Rps23 Pro-64 3,4-dihydroxylase Tpa1-like proline 4-hydroxylase